MESSDICRNIAQALQNLALCIEADKADTKAALRELNIRINNIQSKDYAFKSKLKQALEEDMKL